MARGLLFTGSTLRIHDNLCRRHDPRESPETCPLEFDELVFPRTGVWIRHRADGAHVVDAAAAHVFRRGEVHRVSHPARCGDSNTGLVLAPGVLAELAPAAVDDPAALRPAVPLDDRGYARHARLLADLRAGAADAVELEERALSLAAAVLSRAGRDARPAPPPATSARTRRRRRELAHAARAELAARFAEPWELGELAACLGVSVFHLCRVFRAEFGTTLHAWRRSLRVRAALLALADPARSLAEVALAVGYEDRAQLHRAFRVTLGASPGSFRR